MLLLLLLLLHSIAGNELDGNHGFRFLEFVPGSFGRPENVEVCKASDNGACIITVRANKDAIVAFCFVAPVLGIDGGINFIPRSVVSPSSLKQS